MQIITESTIFSDRTSSIKRKLKLKVWTSLFLMSLL